MAYQIVFELRPSAIFGLPDDDKLVVPPGGEMVSDVYHAPTMRKIGHGTLSKYRDPNDGVHFCFILNAIQFTVDDNFLTAVCADGGEPSAVLKHVTDTLNLFLRSASVYTRRALQYEIVVFTDDAGRIFPPPKLVEMINATVYNCSELTEQMEKAAAMSLVSDDRLAKALMYLRFATFLIENQNNVAQIGTSDFDNVSSAIILNLWKAVSVVIGDPSVDNDYQSRYRSFGISLQYFREEIEPLRKLRDDSDVAHHAVDVEKQKELREKFPRAVGVGATVLAAYQKSIAPPH